MSRIAVIGAVVALSGCIVASDRPDAVEDDPLRPPGIAEGIAVDPAIVGDRLLVSGEPELAIESYVRAAAGPGGMTSDLRVAIARADIALGRLGQAEVLLRDVVSAEPRNASARNDLGVVLFERGQVGEAHRQFQAAFALMPVPEIRENLRLSGRRLRDTVGLTGPEGSFTLTRQVGGVYRLDAVGGDP